MNSTVKTVMFWIFILVCLMLLLSVWQKSASMGKDAEYHLLRPVRQGAEWAGAGCDHPGQRAARPSEGNAKGPVPHHAARQLRGY